MNKLNDFFGTVSKVSNFATKSAESAYNTRAQYDGFKSVFANNPEEKEYYKQRNNCNKRIAIHKLKVFLITVIIPMILLVMISSFNFIPDKVRLIGIIIFISWFGIGITVLLWKSKMSWTKLNLKALTSELKSKEDCDELFL